MKISFNLSGSFFLVFAIAACHSTKKIQKVIASSKKDTVIAVTAITDDPHADSLKFISDVVAKVEKNKIDFKTFSAKMKVSYEGSDGKGSDLTAFLRIQADSIIWVSIVGPLNIEGVRILITPDSVKVLNKLNKELILRSKSYLQEIAKVPLDFKTVQDILIGNPIYLDSNNISFYRNEENGISLLSVGNLFKNYTTFNKNDFTIKHGKLDDVDVMRARTCDLSYQDYEKRDSISFSTYRKIAIAEKSKLDIEISFKQYNFNEALSFPFKVPKNYKKK
ncbi:MAG: DUF4292 domain-containing protein [Bacteroidetes bacterium]|nr:DUF4292 domain-containing protein [Bacteroidota bacterium]MBS1934423.1 DUF4292 domain-containing protein [Bacteroidota bacterium]